MDSTYLISVDRMLEYNYRHANNFDTQYFLRFGEPKVKDVFGNQNLDPPVKQKHSNIENTKRRNHRLDHLSSYYHPLIPRQYMKRSHGDNN